MYLYEVSSLILKMEKILRVKMKKVKLIQKVIILRPTNITKKLLPVTNIIIKPVNSDIYEKNAVDVKRSPQRTVR